MAGLLADSTRGVVIKTFLDGRKPQIIRADVGEWFAGMTPDRLRLITVPQGGSVAAGARAVIMDTTGRELWTVPLPEGATSIYDGPIGDNTLVWVNSTRSSTLVIRALDGAVSVVTWGRDGTIYLARANDNGNSVTVFGIDAASGARKAGFYLPVACDERFVSFAPAARRAACLVTDRRLDLMLLDGVRP